jgi:uncharacterized SAM-binding protein YcdF (DUF218 family)
LATRDHAIVRAVRTFLVLAVLLGAVGVVLTAATVVQHGRTDEARRADAIVVLGAAQFAGRPQEYLVARLEHAQELYDAGTAPRIVTLGGKQPGDRFTEGEAGRAWLVDHGVPEQDVVAIGEGNDTLQSVRSAADRFARSGWSTAVVVTDPWHELRSTKMLADAGVKAYGSPTQTGPSVDGLAVKVRYVARETVAVIAYEVGRWLS